MSAVELLPCPFCGGEPTFIKIGNVHTKMAVTVRCPKCRVERTDATPKAFNNSDHGWLLATAGKNWNKRPAIAPPVAAGSVEMSIKDKIRCGLYPEDFGIPIGYRKEAQLYADWFSSSNMERAEKAEARLKELEAQAITRLPLKTEPQGIVGSGPNAKEGSRPCWTPDCGTF